MKQILLILYYYIIAYIYYHNFDHYNFGPKDLYFISAFLKFKKLKFKFSIIRYYSYLYILDAEYNYLLFMCLHKQ